MIRADVVEAIRFNNRCARDIATLHAKALRPTARAFLRMVWP